MWEGWVGLSGVVRVNAWAGPGDGVTKRTHFAGLSHRATPGRTRGDPQRKPYRRGAATGDTHEVRGAFPWNPTLSHGATRPGRAGLVPVPETIGPRAAPAPLSPGARAVTKQGPRVATRPGRPGPPEARSAPPPRGA